MRISYGLHPVGAGPKGIGDPPSFGIFDGFGGELPADCGFAVASTTAKAIDAMTTNFMI
jgi:hypothetical protein